MLDPASRTTAAVAQPLSTSTNTDPMVYAATPADGGSCFATLTRAFESDPVCNWVWPHRQQYRLAFPRLARAFGGAAIELGSAHYYDGYFGVALWLPPGAAPDEETLAKVIGETAAADRLEAVFSVFEQMGRWHPGEPHWYLPLIGVDPASQGLGVGSALLRHALTQCDRERCLAYLEATSPNNVRLYERHGFEAVGIIQAADSPPLTPMIRTPR